MWITTKGGKRINTDWFDEDEQRKQGQIDANKSEGTNKNKEEKSYPDTFKDGDTPKSIDPKATYQVKKISLDDFKDADYGKNNGEDTKNILKGFHYEEILPGEGMWYKNGVNYGFDVKKVKKE